MIFRLRLICSAINVVYIALQWIVLLFYKKSPRGPPITESLLTLSATAIAKKIRQRKITCYEVADAYVNRIKEMDSYLNAVVDHQYHEVIIQAKKCDKQLEAGKFDLETLEREKPLFGVPCTVKECIAVKGYSNTGCTLPREGVKATDDAVVVELLKNAGAIPLCVTNTPEMCMSFDSTNLLYGHTNNPYDSRYSAGGSSGGEGALLGAGASLIGLGSDLAGSVRVPALYNGVFGHKPTSGIVSNVGHYPSSDDKSFQTLLCIGPLTRYAEDLGLMMRVITSQCDRNLRLDVPVDLRQLKVYYRQELDESFGQLSVTAEIKNCVVRAANHFTKYDVSVEELSIEWPATISEIALIGLVNIEDVPVILLDVDNDKKSLFCEFAKSLLGVSPHMRVTCLKTLIAEGDILHLKSEIPKYKKQGDSIRQKLMDLLGENGVFIYPTFRRSAIISTLSFFEECNYSYTAIFNVFGFPATHVPMGLNQDGLPIGVQVIAAPYQDRLCLAVAKELETAFGGWVPPSPLAIHD